MKMPKFDWLKNHLTCFRPKVNFAMQPRVNSDLINTISFSQIWLMPSLAWIFYLVSSFQLSFYLLQTFLSVQQFFVSLILEFGIDRNSTEKLFTNSFYWENKKGRFDARRSYGYLKSSLSWVSIIFYDQLSFGCTRTNLWRSFKITRASWMAFEQIEPSVRHILMITCKP